MSTISDARFVEVVGLTISLHDLVIPNGETWEIQRISAEASYDSNVSVLFVWDRGGASEEILLATHASFVDFRLNRQLVGNGIKKFALISQNLSSSRVVIGGSWNGIKSVGTGGLPGATNSTVTKTRVDKVIDSNVAASTTDFNELGTPIPSGETWRVHKFGGADIGAGDAKAAEVGFQFANDGVTWVTIRSFGLVSGSFESTLDREFVGDGVRKLRVVRRNNSLLSKKLVAWLSGTKI